MRESEESLERGRRAQEACAELHRRGWSYGEIGRRLGAGPSSVSNTAKGKVRSASKAKVALLESLLEEPVPGGCFVDATETCAKIESLLAAGWTRPEVNRAVGASNGWCAHVLKSRSLCEAGLAEAVAALDPEENPHLGTNCPSGPAMEHIERLRNGGWTLQEIAGAAHVTLAWVRTFSRERPSGRVDRGSALAVLALDPDDPPRTDGRTDSAEAHGAAKRLMASGWTTAEVGALCHRSAGWAQRLASDDLCPETLLREDAEAVTAAVGREPTGGHGTVDSRPAMSHLRELYRSGWRQADIARRAQVSQSWLSGLSRGKYGRVERRLADALMAVEPKGPIEVPLTADLGDDTWTAEEWRTLQAVSRAAAEIGCSTRVKIRGAMEACGKGQAESWRALRKLEGSPY